MSALDTLNEFDLDSIPNLDTAVLGALELFSGTPLPQINIPYKRPLIVGSGNAELTGRILFNTTDAVFADESSYKKLLETISEIDGAVVISASGGKHAVEIGQTLEGRGLSAMLLTTNPNPLSREYFADENIIVFPKNREPYTYNTSTYLGMILSRTGENPDDIREFIEANLLDDLTEKLALYNAYTFVLPAEYAHLRAMLRTKFDELFGTKVVGRFFIEEEMKHAKTVIPDGNELFINFTSTSYTSSNNEINLPVMNGYAGMMATTYYVVGLIQEVKHPYFKENIVDYTKESSRVFGQEINPIVE